MSKIPNPIDRQIGARVRVQRMMLGMSQEKLGEALGVTFQQVQKYEKGANRIGASRLQQIAKILDVPPSYFFETPSPAEPGSPRGFEEAPSTPLVADFLATNEGLQLNAAFARIKNPLIRKRVIDLIQALGAEPTGPHERKK